MPEFCDVALPVPLDMVFTYHVAPESAPVVGGRVLVPFRQQRTTGIVTEIHDRKPSVATKNVLSVLDPAPVLDEQLLRLGRWIADYYLAPIGEVFRTMLPLGAEFKRIVGYRITDVGELTLHQAGMSGSSARSRRTPDEQATEFRVLDHLANSDGDLVREPTLRSATGASRRILEGMVRKKWLAREDVSAPQDASRTIKVAVLKSAEGKLNDNQRKLIDTLTASGGKLPSETLQSLEIPRTTLGTLVKRGLIEIVEEPGGFHCLPSQTAPDIVRLRFESATTGGAGASTRERFRTQVFWNAASRRHGFRKDCGLSGGHALGARGGTFRHTPGPGDWPHPSRGRRSSPDLR